MQLYSPGDVDTSPKQRLCPVISLCFLCLYTIEYVVSWICTCFTVLTYTMLLHGRARTHAAAGSRVSKEGRNSFVVQDLLDVCDAYDGYKEPSIVRS